MVRPFAEDVGDPSAGLGSEGLDGPLGLRLVFLDAAVTGAYVVVFSGGIFFVSVTENVCELCTVVAAGALLK